MFKVNVEYWSLAPVEDAAISSERWNDADRAMTREDVPEGVNLDRFDVFLVMAGGSSESEIDGDGRRTRRRVYTLKIQETDG